MTFKSGRQQWFEDLREKEMPSYLIPLVQQQNIWRCVYSRPHTGTCRRQIASATTLTGLRPPHGFCPVKEGMKESNYCLRLKDSFCFAQRTLAELNKHWIGWEAESMDTDQTVVEPESTRARAQVPFLFGKCCWFSSSFWLVLCFAAGLSCSSINDLMNNLLLWKPSSRGGGGGSLQPNKGILLSYCKMSN